MIATVARIYATDNCGTIENENGTIYYTTMVHAEFAQDHIKAGNLVTFLADHYGNVYDVSANH